MTATTKKIENANVSPKIERTFFKKLFDGKGKFSLYPFLLIIFLSVSPKC
jgi:hypothetical protein